MQWQDFLDNQMAPFGAIPFLVGIGNHEVVFPKTRVEFLSKFGPWHDTPVLRAQRLIDSPDDQSVKTYFHWIDRGVSFFYLDNASNDEFNDDAARLVRTSARARCGEPGRADDRRGNAQGLAGRLQLRPQHERIAEEHRNRPPGVRQPAQGARQTAASGCTCWRAISTSTWKTSYDSQYLREHGGVLPGWVIGTAGAQRYRLPVPSPKVATTNVYGSLLGTVAPDGEIKFDSRR